MDPALVYALIALVALQLVATIALLLMTCLFLKLSVATTPILAEAAMQIKTISKFTRQFVPP